MKYRKTIVLVFQALGLMLATYLALPGLVAYLSLLTGISLDEKYQNLIIVMTVIVIYGYFTHKILQELKIAEASNNGH
jgi:hypothetical protein